MITLREKIDRLRRSDSEEGSGGGMSLVLLLTAVALILVFGLVVDGGAKAAALDDANRVAMEAARAGAQAINGGGSVQIGAAESAINQYLAAEGVVGTSAISETRVEVFVTITTPTKVLSMVGINEMTVTGEGFAYVINTQGG